MSETEAEQTPAPQAAPAPAPEAPKIDLSKQPPIAQHLAGMSDRAIQRVTGGNAFLRGRQYARRKSVQNLRYENKQVYGEIHVRSQEEPYRTEVVLSGENTFTSSCTCPGWRGPDAHCKHVAAIMVCLRDKVRPPKPKPDPQQQQQQKKEGGRKRRKKKKKNDAEKLAPVHVPGTVSVGGKRRRNRRRRRGSEADAAIDMLTGKASGSQESHGQLDAWMPPEALARTLEFEYRLTVRPSSVTVTPVVANSRKAVPIEAALAAFNMIGANERAVFRALARHSSRGQPTLAELRGEDAAEIFALFQGHKVLIEPASMELRFHDEPLEPRIELERGGGGAVRVRIHFVQPSNNRRFSLSSGVWFPGTPGYHLDVTEGVARPLAAGASPGWLERLLTTPSLAYTEDELPGLLTDAIPRVANALGAELPDLSQIADLVDEAPHIVLRTDGDIVGALARLEVRYADRDFVIPAEGFAPPLAFLPPKRPGGRPRVVRRDVGQEMAAVAELASLGFEEGEIEDTLFAEGDDAIRFWTEGINELPKDWERFVPDDLANVRVRGEAVSPQMRVASGVDWLSLDMTFSVGDAVVREDELRACLESGRHIVRLEDGSFAPVDPDAVGEVLSRMAEIYATSGDAAKIPVSQAGRINDLLAMVDDSEVTTKAKTLFSKLDDVGEIPKVAKPADVKATLRPYQQAGFNWLAFIHKLASGGILADDMGLGKTLQTITLLTWAKKKEKKKLNLVVAPTSVAPNWAREIAKFSPKMKTVLWQGSDRHALEGDLEKADIMITSYALLRRDAEVLEKQDFRYVILDEAQHIKNPMSQTARAAKKLPAERRLALTGTPIENRLSEIWSIIDFVSPGLLGPLKAFEDRFAKPIDRGDMEAAERLRKTIQPFVLRRLKSDVVDDLPEKIEQEIVVPLADEQDTLYKQILGEVRKSVLSEVESQGVAKSQIQILAALTRLRQVACDPRLMKLPEQEFTDAHSGKLGALREIIQEAKEGGHRVLVFSQFVQMLQIIRRMLDEDRVDYEYLDGSTKDRADRVDRFNEDESLTCFLISLKAGGTGLNLTGADTVVHFDPWWNPAVEDQATDRAHRIGQTRVVNVYRLIARGTVEEKILELSDKKRALMTNVLSTEGSPLKGLTRTDVDDLFS